MSISDNAQSKKRALAQPKKSSAGSLTQMQISLGQQVQKKCKTCGMEYIQSSAEDRRLHDKYHKQNMEGYDVGKEFVQRARPTSVFQGVRSGDSICNITCFDKLARKKRGQAVLEIVQRELGAVDIPEEAIWDPNKCSSPVDADYHSYLYIRGTKCIGFLLTRRIKESYRVVEPTNINLQSESRDQSEASGTGKARDALRARQQAEAKRNEELSKRPVELSDIVEPAILGISRIWVSAAYRQQGLASALLDTAFVAHDAGVAQRERIDAESRVRPDMQNGVYERIEAALGHFWPPVPKLKSFDDVAFSQPTEAGTRLARRWFGKTFGWKVYMD